MTLKGLKYEIDAPDTQVGRDTLTSIDRKDLTGSSFAFIPTRSVWIEEGDKTIRQVEDLDLYDVGPVTWPAYEATSTLVRSSDKESLQKEFQEWRLQKQSAIDEVRMRMRLTELDS